MNPHALKEVLPSDIPTIGYGVVMQQPVGTDSDNSHLFQSQNISNSWQHEQLLMAKQGQSGLDGSGNYVENVQRYQQWCLAQQKASQEQILVLHDKIKKQKQYDEQKQRLKDANSYKSKNIVSADAMIENILSKEQSLTKTKSRMHEPGLTQIRHHQPFPVTPQHLQMGISINSPNIGLYSTTTTTPQVSQITTSPASPSIIQLKNDPESEQNFSRNVVTNLMNNAQNTDGKNKSLQLPIWLSDSEKLPEIYKRACGLVESGDGWVDTSRTYMILMRTNLPPQYLGIIWEMVNRSQPGVLKVTEFYGLLALVALVQKGVPFTNADVLLSLDTPVYPLIDHPILLPLVNNQKGTGLPETDNPDSIPQPVNQSSIVPQPVNQSILVTQPENQTSIVPSSSALQSCTISTEDDDFDDFVSAQPSTNKTSTHSLFVKNENMKSKENERSINMPTVGNSPLNRNKNSDVQEEFADFQTAMDRTQSEDSILNTNHSVTSEITNTNHSVTSEITNTNNSVTSERTNDKYDVFRILTQSDSTIGETNSSLNKEEDDSYGEFCTSETIKDSLEFTFSPSITNPITKKTSFSENIVNKFSEDNLFDSRVATVDASTCSWGKDPFGEFETFQKRNLFPADSDSSQYMTANASADLSSDSEDGFGEFIGPTSQDKLDYKPNSLFLNVTEPQAETSSVMSLELPGLEDTVNLSSKGLKTVSKEENDIENDFKALSLCGDQLYSNSSPTLFTNQSLNQIQLNDKYSIMKDQSKVTFDKPYIESWRKCLEGSYKLFLEALNILENIEVSSLLPQVLDTSQMQNYLTNLGEVKEVEKRICQSSRNLAIDDSIEELLSKNETTWNAIDNIIGDKVDCFKGCYKIDNGVEGEANICSLCLVKGGASMEYAGFSYHPPCSNLWLNVVDLTLPSIQIKSHLI